MTMFALALGAFILLHVGLAATPLRAMTVKAIGEGPYRGLFSLASAAVLAWMIWSFAIARADPANALLWSPPTWARHVTATLVLVGMVFVVAGLVTMGPTTAGLEGGLAKPDPARGMMRISRHPFLWGVAFWGAGHLISNPETTSVMLFGGLAVMALLGTRSIDRKSAARDPENWARFKALTSNVPFAAIVQGRNRLSVGEILVGLAVGLVIFALVAYFHRLAFGVRAFEFGV